jgi:hypothetical protein
MQREWFSGQQVPPSLMRAKAWMEKRVEARMTARPTLVDFFLRTFI